jgi:hypothetical protein
MPDGDKSIKFIRIKEEYEKCGLFSIPFQNRPIMSILRSFEWMFVIFLFHFQQGFIFLIIMDEKGFN